MKIVIPLESGDVVIRALSSNDLDEVVYLHTEVFPDDFLTYLGRKVLRLFYAQFVDTSKNIALVAETSGNIVGFVMGTLQAPSLYRKFYRRHFVKIAFAVFTRLLDDPIIRGGFFARTSHVHRALVAVFTGAGTGAGAYLHDIGGNEGASVTAITARLLSIGVALNSRGTGVANKLVDYYCASAARLGEKVVGLSVLSNNLRAIHFYKKSGWIPEFETQNSIYFFRPVHAEDNVLPASETRAIVERYERRKGAHHANLYNRLSPAVYMSQQEKERALIRWIKKNLFSPLQDKRLLEVGCGTGGNLVDMIRLGFRPENLIGNELMEERASEARKTLPAETKILTGDALNLDFGNEKFDIVYQSTVFTSILDEAFQSKLAVKMWDFVRPGGYVLWYDFIYNNPGNSDVKGVSLHRIRHLFPEGEVGCERLTLAPPISRRVCRLHPSLYNLFNAFPFLRTHVLCWIRKAERQ